MLRIHDEIQNLNTDVSDGLIIYEQWHKINLLWVLYARCEVNPYRRCAGHPPIVPHVIIPKLLNIFKWHLVLDRLQNNLSHTFNFDVYTYNILFTLYGNQMELYTFSQKQVMVQNISWVRNLCFWYEYYLMKYKEGWYRLRICTV